MTNLKVSADVQIKSTSSLQGLNVLPQVGFIMPFAGPTTKIPNGWLLCNGASISSTTYPILYSMIGPTLPNLLNNSIVGTVDSASIGTTGGSNTHVHSTAVNFSTNSAETPAHENAAAASNWGNVTVSHDHNWNYSFGVPYGVSNSYSNNPINVTAGNQANVWNSPHNHQIASGGINYNAADITHSHTGNVSATQSIGNSHSHPTNVTQQDTSASTMIPIGIYFNYIIKAG